MERVDYRSFDPEWIIVDATPYSQWFNERGEVVADVSSVEIIAVEDYEREIDSEMESYYRECAAYRCAECGNRDGVPLSYGLRPVECSADCGGKMYPESVDPGNLQRRLPSPETSSFPPLDDWQVKLLDEIRRGIVKIKPNWRGARTGIGKALHMLKTS